MRKKQQHVGALRCFQIGETEVRVGKINLLAKREECPFVLSISAQMPAGYHVDVKLGCEEEATRNKAYDSYTQEKAEQFMSGPIATGSFLTNLISE